MIPPEGEAPRPPGKAARAIGIVALIVLAMIIISHVHFSQSVTVTTCPPPYTSCTQTTIPVQPNTP